jgi:hypothetical protein
MNTDTVAAEIPAPHTWLERLASARFFSASLIVHVVLLILVGGMVVMQSGDGAPDFEAGDGSGLFADSSELPAPPEMPANASQSALAAGPALPAPSMAAITTNALSTAYSVSASQVNVSTNSMSDSLASRMNAMGKNAERAAGAGLSGMGKAGGTKMGMIFGRKVEAKKLGVILDVSGSAHPKLASAIQEIDKAFGDSILILYPGCGMVDDKKGRKLHQIRKFSAIPKKELEGDIPRMSTAGQLIKALKIPEFEKLTSRPNMKERLFVSWFEGNESDKGHLITHTDAAFEDLIAKGVDSIYWFADFRDKVSAEAAEDLLKELKRKKIKVYLHNFATPDIAPQIVMLAEKTGGTTNVGEVKK